MYMRLVFVRVFAEYSYDVSRLRDQLKFFIRGVSQRALVSAFVVEWVKKIILGYSTCYKIF
jgi:hypothetical protein